MLQHLAEPFRRLSREFQPHRIHALNFWSVSQQTWEIPKKKLFDVFSAHNENFRFVIFFFIVATAFASPWVAILWISLPSYSYSKSPNRFSADMRTSETHFLTLLARNAIFLRNNFDFVSTFAVPFDFKWTAVL